MRIPLLGRLVLLALLSIGVLGARFSWATTEHSLWFQTYLGYPMLLALLLASVLFFLAALRAKVGLNWRQWRDHRWALAAVVGLSVFLHVHEPHVMRLFYDEPAFAADAQTMHLEKHPGLPGSSNYVGDVFVTRAEAFSYRQYLYPLVVSLVHDVTGYRVANLFVVNALLTPLILLAGYLVAWRMAGRLAGLVTLGLLGALPLLAQNVTGAGYDVLALALLGCLILFTMEYATAPLADRAPLMNLSLATALLLAVTRNETILYLVPWALVTLVLWWRERSILVTWFVALSPLFLLPNLLVDLRMNHEMATLYTDMRPDGAAFFSVDYLQTHIPQALYYFFNFSLDSTNNLLLSLLGTFGVIGLLVVGGGAWRRHCLPPRLAVFVVFAGAALGGYLVVLTMFWSDPNDPVVARLSLGLLFAGAVAGGWFVGQFGWANAHRQWILGFLAAWLLVVATPAMARAFQTNNIIPGRAGAWYLAEAEKRDRKTTFFIADGALHLVAHRFAASNMKYLNADPASFVRALKAGLYREIIVFEDYGADSSLGGWAPRKNRAPTMEIVTEPIVAREFTPRYRAQVSRFVGYRKPDGTLITPASDDPEVRILQSFKTEEERSRYRLSLYP